MKSKPDKWYFKNLKGGEYKYIFNVKNIEDAYIRGKDISKIDDDEKFYVKCLNCIKYDIDGICVRDDTEFLFDKRCMKEVDKNEN